MAGIGTMLGFGGISDWVAPRRNAILGLSAGLLSGDLGNAPRYAMEGRQIDDANAIRAKEEAERQQQINQTTEWLKLNYPQFSNLPPAQGFQLATQLIAQQQKPAPDPADSATGRQELAAQYGLQGEDATRFILTGELPGGNTSVRAGMGQPIPVRNVKTGQTGAAMPMSDGTYMNPFTQQPFDQDWEFDPAWVAAQRAQGTAVGKATGGAQFDLPKAELIVQQTVDAINAVRAEKKGMEEHFGMGGLQQLTPAWPGSEKAKFQVAATRAINRAFLEGREMLKGGGQITDFESKKAEAAITEAELAMQKGDKAQFEAALDTFEQAVKDGYEKLKMQAGGMPAISGAAPQGAVNYVYNPSTGKLEPQ